MKHEVDRMFLLQIKEVFEAIENRGRLEYREEDINHVRDCCCNFCETNRIHDEIQEIIDTLSREYYV